MAERQLWCRVRLVDRQGGESGRYSLEGYGDPDLTAVDVVARLGLLAARLEHHLVLEDVCEALAGLLDLAGLHLDEPGTDRWVAGRAGPSGPTSAD